MATLKDVTKLASVDVSTVSRALNNTSYVHPDTKERIYAAARELGYHPNVMAQALRQGKRHTIGVVVPRLHMAIFSEILQGIEQQASGLGYATLICSTNDNAKTEKEWEITSQSDREVNSFRYGYDCANQLLDENPDLDAIMASVDVQGLGAIRAVSERGLRIPEDVKVISLTGHRVGRMLETTMTSMEMPAFEMGKAAAKMTIDDIEADSKHKPGRRHLTFATPLVEREST